MITSFLGYGNCPQFWSLTSHAHDPDVAMGESLALEISILEKKES